MVGGTEIALEGSPAFRQAVIEALDRWRGVDPEAADLLLSVRSITEHDEGFKVYTLDNQDVFVSSSVAFWPRTSGDLQINILATYLAHESVHAYLRDIDNEHWRDDEGERLANKYQELVATRLEVPLVYVVEPAKTLGVDYKQFIDSNDGWIKVGVLSAAALGTLIVVNRK